MRKIVIAVMLACICLPALAGHKQKKKNKRGDRLVSVTMYRTACFGRCPEYTIEINKNGLVTYTGIRFVTDSGVFNKNIGTTQAAEILNKFKTYRVDTCKNLYVNRIQDVPGIFYTITYKDSTKMIRNANFGPVFLRQLAEEMDNIGREHDSSWKKAPAEKK